MKKWKSLKGRLATTLIVTMLTAAMAPMSFAAGAKSSARAVEGIEFDKEELTLNPGGTATLTLTAKGETSENPATPDDASPAQAKASDSVADANLMVTVTSSNSRLVTIDSSKAKASASELQMEMKDGTLSIPIQAVENPDFTTTGNTATITASATVGGRTITAKCTVKVSRAEAKASIKNSTIKYGGSTIITATAKLKDVVNPEVKVEADLPDGLTDTDPSNARSFEEFTDSDSEKEGTLTIYSDPQRGIAGDFVIPVTITVTGENGFEKTYKTEVKLTVEQPTMNLTGAELLTEGETAEISLDPDCDVAKIEGASYQWKVTSGEGVISLADEGTSEVTVKGEKEGKAALELTVTAAPNGPVTSKATPVTLTETIELTVVKKIEAAGGDAQVSVNPNAVNVNPDAYPEAIRETVRREIEGIKAALQALGEQIKALTSLIKTSSDNAALLFSKLPEMRDGETVEYRTNQQVENVGTNVAEDGAVTITNMNMDISLECYPVDADGNADEARKTDTNLANGHTMTFPIALPSKGITNRYANVKHRNHKTNKDETKQYTIQNRETNPYILVTVDGFSPFELTFTDKELSSGNRVPTSNGGSRRGGGRGGSSYRPAGQWMAENGRWYLRQADGSRATNCWLELSWNGAMQWFRFGADGYMLTGWFTDIDGNRYFMHNISDGNQGVMYTGWHFIEGRWYYFRDTVGGPKGSLLVGGVTPDGYTTDAAGACLNYPGNTAQ